jgi:hypothetical protein
MALIGLMNADQEARRVGMGPRKSLDCSRIDFVQWLTRVPAKHGPLHHVLDE